MKTAPAAGAQAVTGLKSPTQTPVGKIIEKRHVAPARERERAHRMSNQFRSLMSAGRYGVYADGRFGPAPDAIEPGYGSRGPNFSQGAAQRSTANGERLNRGAHVAALCQTALLSHERS